MNLERLRVAFDVAYSTNRIVVLPQPLAGPWILVQDREPVAIGRHPVTAAIVLRNVGADDCRIHSIRSRHPALTIGGHPEQQILPGHTVKERSTLIDLTIDPFQLTDSRTMAVVDVEFRGISGGERQTVSCTVECVRQAVSGAVLLVDRPAIAFHANVRGLHLFATPAPRSNTVELDIVDPPGLYRRKAMRRSATGQFALAVPLEDGTRYAYRFNIDGVFRRDVAVPVVEDVPGAGECSPLDVPRRGHQTVRVRNAGAHDLKIEVRTETPWLTVLPTRYRIKPGDDAEVTVQAAVAGLSCGTHTGSVTLNTNDPTAAVHTIPVVLHLEAPGPVIGGMPGAMKLGTVYAGRAVENVLELRNLGSERLAGRISSDDDAIKPVEFAVAPAGVGQVAIRVEHHAAPPGGSERKKARLIIDNNTVVVDEQRVEVPVEYVLALTPLKFTPAEIDFGAITIGRRTSIPVRVGNEAGGRVEAEIHSGVSIPPWLHLSMPREGEIVVEVCGDRWSGPKDEAVKLAIRLRDRKTDYSGILRVRGEFVVPTLEPAQRRLSFGAVPKKTTRALPMTLTNSGRGALDIRQIVVDQQWVSVAAAAVQPADSAVTLNVTINSASLPAGVHRAQLDFHTNDPATPMTSLKIDVGVR